MLTSDSGGIQCCLCFSGLGIHQLGLFKAQKLCGGSQVFSGGNHIQGV